MHLGRLWMNGILEEHSDHINSACACVSNTDINNLNVMLIENP